jgi:DNA-binding transcriptional regulator YiaG
MKKKNRKYDSKGRFLGDTRAGKKILASLYDLADTLEAGIPLEQKYTVRVVEIPEPGDYGAKEIKALRHRLKLSQALFAQLIGASTILVQKWEAGDRHPDGMARRLMDDINADPQRFLKMFMRHEKNAG